MFKVPYKVQRSYGIDVWIWFIIQLLQNHFCFIHVLIIYLYKVKVQG